MNPPAPSPTSPPAPTHALAAARSVLVLVDYQTRLMPAIHRGAHVVAQATRLADIALAIGVPVIGTEQNPKGLGPNEPAIRERCIETLPKMHFDACADGLVDRIRALASGAGREPATHAVVAGCEAHVCMMQTALGLLDAGLRVHVVAAACGSRAPADHALALQRLLQAGAVIASVEMTAFEWLHTCANEHFKRVLALVKNPIA